MRFSDLKKDKQNSIEISSSQSPLLQKTLAEHDIKKEGEDKVNEKSLLEDNEKEKSRSVSNQIDDDIKELRESIRSEVKFDLDFKGRKERGERISFDEVEYERTVDFYSLLLKRFSGVVEKVSDGSYLTASDDLRYLSSSIYEEIENRYLPLMLSYLTPGNYIISHSINLAILSGLISKRLNFEKELTLNTITAGLCIDLGMLNWRDLYSCQRRFSKSERELIKTHVRDGVDIVTKIFSFEEDLKDFVALVVENSHERYDGSGYYSKTADELDVPSQIVAISDFYEALTQPRPWRDAYEKPLAVELITSRYRSLFAPIAIKGLISVVGMYPPGSLVRLSTGEVAEVVFVDKEKILRPLVRVFVDLSLREIAVSYINLADYPLTFIESYLKDEEILKLNPEFKRTRDFKRLWIEW